nr:RNA-directed DNA polymerase, eukaryota [Tanacetum cinerariifolium]
MSEGRNLIRLTKTIPKEFHIRFLLPISPITSPLEIFGKHVGFERPHKPVPEPSNGNPNNFEKGRGGMGYRKSNDSSRSYANAVNGASLVVNPGSLISASPDLVLDEKYVKLKYLGGLWIILEFEKEEIKKNLMAHLGVNSWFQTIQEVPLDFVSDERIAWVDIEGVPLNAWTSDTFTKIGKK